MNQLDKYFIYKCEKGLVERGLSDKPEYVERLKFELDTITRMGFSGYFLIVADFINWAKRNNIYVGPGRGSAAGCLASYCLRITNLDPIRWKLLFERFLNPDRISMPDIDVDFENRRRDLVLNYVAQRYGEDHVAHIGTFGTMKAKSAVKDVCRVLNEPILMGEKLSKLLLAPVHGKPQPLKVSFEKVAELNKYLKDPNSREGTVLRWAEKVENLVKSMGVHACGAVIGNESIHNKIPLFKGRSGEVTTQWEMGNIEDLGFIKFDFLGVEALDKMHACVDIVKERHGTDIDMENIPLDDELVFSNLRAGDAVGIFQLEASAGMKDLLVQIRPTSVEDLIALVAIYRPGPLCLSGDTPILTNIFQGKHKTEYKCETLKSLYDIYQSKLITKRRPRSIKSIDENYCLVSNQIKAIHKSGVKPVYSLDVQVQLTNNYKTSDSKPMRRTEQIKASLDHKFLTLRDNLVAWKSLSSLQEGDYLAVNYRGHFGARRSENVYGKKNFRNIAFRHYQYRCVICDWNKGSLDVNHIDGNRNTNNSAENLCFLCPNHHREYTEGTLSKETILAERKKQELPLSADIMFVRYKDKHYVGEEETYDIEMQSPLNNFIAGDFVVHNSSDYKDIYLDVRAGNREPEYLVPELAPILERTGGWLIYQEQILEIAKRLCDYTGGEADELRKAVGKKKQKLMDKHESKFKQGWINSGLPAPAADKLWNDMVGFASYAFNRSHAAAYAFITYQTAYLKAHYPTEYLCAVMLCVGKKKKDHLIRCITECKRLGIKVSPPDINESKENFSVAGDGQILFGLGPIKNVGASSAAILEERKKAGPFTSLRNFCERVDMGIVNRGKLESLIKAGCFDRFGQNRATMLGAVEKIWQHRDEMKKYDKKMQTYERKEEKRLERLKEIEEGSKKKPLKPWPRPEEPQWPDIVEMDELSDSEIHTFEHELLGFFVSSHPLDNVSKSILFNQFTSIDDMRDMLNDQPVKFAGIITNVKEITTKAKKQKMAFILVEDLTGSIEATIFSAVYNRVSHLLDQKIPLQIEGNLDITEADDEDKTVKIKISNITLLDLNATSRAPDKIDVCVPALRADELLKLLDKYAGDLHEVRPSVILGDGTKVRFQIRPYIGNHKGVFMKEVEKLRNGETQ